MNIPNTLETLAENIRVQVTETGHTLQTELAALEADWTMQRAVLENQINNLQSQINNGGADQAALAQMTSLLEKAMLVVLPLVAIATLSHCQHVRQLDDLGDTSGDSVWPDQCSKLSPWTEGQGQGA